MSRIRILDDEVANKIAAGEVVERPASVVKELVENAIDAGATRLVVELEDGGRRRVQVADNGCGMSAEEAVLALQRHATSKITRAEDLTSIRTLGFRGEALPSIASVSRLTLVTCAADAPVGVRLVVEGGEIHTMEEVGAPVGTTFTITDLFYNTPARSKFLKSARTELGQACDWLIRIALAHPHLSVRLTHDGVETLYSPGSPERMNAVAALYGREVARELLPVGWERGGIRIEGYVSRPTFTRPTRSGQSFFVNGRFVRNRTLTHALDEAYRAGMPSGRFAFAVLALTLDPAVVDVNVHPTKAEVRFLREWELHRAVYDAVKGALGPEGGVTGSASFAAQALVSQEHLRRAPWTAPGSGEEGTGGGSRNPPLRWPPGETGSSAARPVGTAAVAPDEDDPFADPPLAGVAAGDPGETSGTALGSQAGLSDPPFGLDPQGSAVLPSTDHPAPSAEQPLLPGVPAAPALRPVCQLWSSYILAEGQTGLVIVDQHLAHERVLFDRMLAAPAGGGAAAPPLASQRLTTPLTLTLAHRQAVVVEAHLEELTAFGFELEAFGHDAFLVRGVPPFVRPGAEPTLLHEILEELAEFEGGDRLAARRDRVAATAACKAAVKKGERLAREEIQRLLDDLLKTTQPYTCPHGCPIAVEISYQELLKRFKRV